MYRIFVPVLVGFTMLLSSCGAPNGTTTSVSSPTTTHRLQIVTSFAPIYSFAVNVAGDRADVHNLVPPGASIHTWELDMSGARMLDTADVVILHGLGLEAGLGDSIRRTVRPSTRIIESAKDVPALPPLTAEVYGTGTEEVETGNVDPHTWLSPRLARLEVEAIAHSLGEIDPANAAVYRANATAYEKRLDTLDTEIRADLAKVPAKDFILFHDAFQYYLRDYGLIDHRLGIIEASPGREP